MTERKNDSYEEDPLDTVKRNLAETGLSNEARIYLQYFQDQATFYTVDEAIGLFDGFRDTRFYTAIMEDLSNRGANDKPIQARDVDIYSLLAINDTLLGRARVKSALSRPAVGIFYKQVTNGLYTLPERKKVRGMPVPYIDIDVTPLLDPDELLVENEREEEISYTFTDGAQILTKATTYTLYKMGEPHGQIGIIDVAAAPYMFMYGHLSYFTLPGQSYAEYVQQPLKTIADVPPEVKSHIEIDKTMTKFYIGPAFSPRFFVQP